MVDTPIIFNIDAGTLVVALFFFFTVLLGIVWKGKSEILKAIKEALGDFQERFISMESKMEILWKNETAPPGSPRQLNERGIDILEKSGIKAIVDNKKTKLLELVKAKKIDNPYDTEEAIEEIMMELPKHCPDIVSDLKDGAFKVGADIPTLLFVGAIYLRNQIFKDLGFNVEDLDKSKT